MQPGLCSSKVCFPSCLPARPADVSQGSPPRSPPLRDHHPVTPAGLSPPAAAAGAEIPALAGGKAQTAQQSWCSRGELVTRNCASQWELHVGNYSSASGKRCAKGKGWVFEHCDQSLPMASAASGPRTGFCSRRYNKRVNQSSAPTSSCQQTTLLLL